MAWHRHLDQETVEQDPGSGSGVQMPASPACQARARPLLSLRPRTSRTRTGLPHPDAHSSSQSTLDPPNFGRTPRTRRSLSSECGRTLISAGELERNTEVIKVVRPRFNKEIFPDATIREGVNRRFERENQECHVPSSMPPLWRTVDWSHLPWTRTGTKCVGPSRGSGVGVFVVQVCGDEQGVEHPQPRWMQEEQAVGSERG